jgi:hypothetical protein
LFSTHTHSHEKAQGEDARSGNSLLSLFSLPRPLSHVDGSPKTTGGKQKRKKDRRKKGRKTDRKRKGKKENTSERENEQTPFGIRIMLLLSFFLSFFDFVR